MPQRYKKVLDAPNLFIYFFNVAWLFIFFLSTVILFLSSPKEKESKRKVRKRPVSEAVCPIFQNTQWTRYAQTAFRISLLRLRSAIRDSILFQKILHTLKTSSCGMFSRSIATRKHEAQSAVIDLWSLGSSKRSSSAGLLPTGRKNVFEELPRRQAFSVVGVKEIWRTLKGWTQSAP